MLEEEKVVEAEVVEEAAPAQEAPAAQAAPEMSEADKKKTALLAFIFALVALRVCPEIPFAGPVVGLIFAAIALKKLKLTGGLTAKPHAIFVKIAKPVAIVALILDIIFLAFWPILIGVTCGAAVCAAAGEAASSLVLF